MLYDSVYRKCLEQIKLYTKSDISGCLELGMGVNGESLLMGSVFLFGVMKIS